MTICLFLLMVGKASAQWSVIDPTNIAQSIINSSNNIVHTCHRKVIQEVVQQVTVEVARPLSLVIGCVR